MTDYRQRIAATNNDRLAERICGPRDILVTGSLSGYDGEPLLRRVTAPTLFLCGLKRH